MACTVLVLCLPNIISSTQCSDRDREALLQFKRGISDYSGQLTSWGRNANCCQWNGIHCSNQTGHVIAIEVVSVQGKISPSLGELKHLKILNLSTCEFQGEIPPQLGNLSRLTTLDLSSNSNLYVKSLHWISRLSLLRYLDLSGTDLSKATDWMIIVTNLRYLSFLRMELCQLPSKIPSSLAYNNSSVSFHTISLLGNRLNDSSVFFWLFNWPGITTQLLHLDLSENEFQGLVPSEIGKMQSLSYLDLSYNGFQGIIPSELGNMHSLSYLDLSRNGFQDLIPSEFGNLHSLSYLSLSDNKFEGSVFKILTEFSKLQQLYLTGNNFTDELTDVVQALVSSENRALVTLDLSENKFWGAIPDTTASFSSLRELYLNENRLNGNIARGIGQLSMLEKLDLSSNSFDCTLTQNHFLNLSRLRELYLSDNLRLLINADVNWIPPFQLDVISLRSCKLGPRLPKWLQMQKNFSYLDASNADISDSLPVSFLNSNIQFLNMSSNKFYGMLQMPPEKLEILSFLDLSSNLFEGIIPAGLTKVQSLYLNDNRFSDSSYILCPTTPSSLSELDLSNNLFSGQLPDCWTNLNQLSSLHLENNRFSGTIPKSIGMLKNLKYLHLYNNTFSGSIPDSLMNCTSLIILNLGYNLLTGCIPSWIGNALHSIGALILRRNRFHGGLPVTICQLPGLQILDIAINNISGVIPNCIGNFTSMNGSNASLGISFGFTDTEYGREKVTKKDETTIISWKGEEQRIKITVILFKVINLSDNKLVGGIPDGISSLTTLDSLDLSRNKLNGSIPSEIGDLRNLQLLKFSDNHLTGYIPDSLATVITLAVFDVSNNKLVGKIPVGTQLQTFDASSYMGNPGLCGAPLPDCQKNQPPSNSQNEDNVKSRR